jgi:hypothetical protein
MKTAKINDSIVVEADTPSWRWYDIYNGVKFDLGTGFPTDDTTGDPSQFTMTVTEAGTGNTTAVNAASSGSSMLITTAANEYDGINLQLKGESFKLTSSKPLYFGCKFKVSDATQSDIFIGLAETDTTLMATSSAHAIALGGDGAFFSKLDASTTIAGKMYLNGSQTATANYATALVADTFMTVEIYWDGSTMYYYVDGTLIQQISGSLGDGEMTPSVNFRAGAAAAKTMDIAWLRCFQAL